ncbi:hypothetical protein BU16DRAFT_540179 [Lophium mytilinum]|uniref:F-box domain-containing protein n=1 Tax=Lophium mytilinum TaxID=390894 RepID=A0A6A6QS54_9PEZI|nr:hypothetical protein BU16DRAFT_540179 [Lophium mytilinum]
MAKDPVEHVSLVARRCILPFMTLVSYPGRKVAAQHNATASSFLHLPLELLLSIGGYLSPLSRFRLGHTCKTLRSTFPLPAGFFPLNEFDEQISQLERKDRLPSAWGVELWRCQISPQNTVLFPGGPKGPFPQFCIWCIGCSTRHPAYFFSPQQRASPPLTRRCIQTEHKLRLCAHESFTSAELYALLGPRMRKECRHADHKVAHWQNKDSFKGYPHVVREFSPPIPYFPAPFYEYAVRRQLSLARISLDLPAVKAVALLTSTIQTLPVSDQLICPHGFKDSSLAPALKRIMTSPMRWQDSEDDYNVPNGMQPTLRPCWAAKHCILHCTIAECPSWSYLLRIREPNKSYEEFVLKSRMVLSRSPRITYAWLQQNSREWAHSIDLVNLVRTKGADPWRVFIQHDGLDYTCLDDVEVDQDHMLPLSLARLVPLKVL